MESVDILLDLVRGAGSRGLALRIAQNRLEEILRTKGYGDPVSAVQQAVTYALENWIIDKIVDNADSLEESPARGHTWFLCVVSPEETAKLQSFPQVKQEILRILRECNDEGHVGEIRKEDMLVELRRRGFDVDEALITSSRVQDFSTAGKDRTIEYWYGLIPRYEQTEEYKAMIQELADRAIEKRTRVDEAISRSEEAREKRNAARRAKRAAEKKTSTKKKPSKKSG